MRYSSYRPPWPTYLQEHGHPHPQNSTRTTVAGTCSNTHSTTLTSRPHIRIQCIFYLYIEKYTCTPCTCKITKLLCIHKLKYIGDTTKSACMCTCTCKYVHAIISIKSGIYPWFHTITYMYTCIYQVIKYFITIHMEWASTITYMYIHV